MTHSAAQPMPGEKCVWPECDDPATLLLGIIPVCNDHSAKPEGWVVRIDGALYALEFTLAPPQMWRMPDLPEWVTCVPSGGKGFEHHIHGSHPKGAGLCIKNVDGAPLPKPVTY